MSSQPGWPGGFDPSSLGEVFGQLQRIFSAGESEGPVNWQLARETALETLEATEPGAGAGTVTRGPRIGFGSEQAGGGAAATLTPAEAEGVAGAARVADTWLDEVTAFPAIETPIQAWTPRQWIDKTLPTWRNLVTPVAARMAEAMGAAVNPGGQLPPGLPPEAASMLAGAGPMLQRLGGGLLGIQLGQAIGALAKEVTGPFDVGYPLAGATAALLPRAVAAGATDAGLPPEEARLFAALRELAHARLFSAAAWLAPTLLSGIEAYAAGIQVDPERLRDLAAQVDPADPARLSELMSSGVLEPPSSPAQQAAIARLELLLALVEGWVETVTGAAARAHLPHTDSLLEWQRRRRAVGGPAERTFGALVGLELRPRRMREAAAWWAAADPVERDKAWAHPDLLPEDFTAAEPPDESSAARDADVDEELRRMLDGDQ